jgi:hypothetical protein
MVIEEDNLVVILFEVVFFPLLRSSLVLSASHLLTHPKRKVNEEPAMPPRELPIVIGYDIVFHEPAS